ncbi:M12 family metallopeptidase [Gloeothece verrucosa]|uniref:Peptidase M10A and M12B matrixin and adamalysin n=1 Tax=Gloeothece verrucosa (strain PCC 7822) TaxID=497965 RepID=E0UEA1_GLOV7|nr:M12 family metallopeptidase [Gloeothece verrucosa]ADN14226.1 peptidase M10A and M12B matrixin and adamalysin [Gloeothece verrucosa PCC 7822]
MTEILQIGSSQLEQLIKRIENIESKLGIQRESKDATHPANEALKYCSLPKVPPQTFNSNVSLDRVRLIQLISKKWVNGTKLRYYFFEKGDYAAGNDQKDIVRQGFEEWKKVGIGIKFEEVRSMSEAEIRIGFLQGDGAWSYIGRDILTIPKQGERTMNFGWDLRTDPRRVDVPVHEIGHTLGFPHEHQNPFAGIVWNEEAVYRYFGGPPNKWDRETTFFNILQKLAPGEVQGTQWDPNSIMHYAFAAGLIDRPEQYRNGLNPAGGLSERDLQQAKFFYPPLDESSYPELKASHSEVLSLAPAEQKNFVINPPATQSYTIQTFGKSDTVMVLFEDINGDLKYVDGDDDSGTDTNAQINVRLYKGRRYVLRIRLYSNFSTGETSVMFW